jgi:hypothetical protein
LMTTKTQLDAAAKKLLGIKEALALLSLELALKSFNPKQPRWPAGRSDGGQWRSDGVPRVAQTRIGVFDPTRMPGCLEQLNLDEEICRAVQSRKCWESSRTRYDNCMKDLFIPFLEVGR